MSQNNTARVIGHIEISKTQQKEAANKTSGKPLTRPLSSVLFAANDPEADRPVVQLPSGGHRAIACVRVIPHMNFADVTTVPDAMDKGESRTIRLPLNTPCVGWVKTQTISLVRRQRAEEVQARSAARPLDAILKK
jgi:hypothetical protein